MVKPKRVSIGVARRMALAAQGFSDRPPSAQPTVRHFRRAMDRMTILQLDSVNVVCRSHYLPILARLGPYDRDKLNRFLYYSGENFEYLGHEASITSQALHPYLRWRMARSRWRRGVALEQKVPQYVQGVLDEVAEHGPLTVKDLSDPGRRTGPWWGQSKGKVALEWLYVSGRLAVRERNKMFVTAYDLPERVIRPEILATPDIDESQAHRHLLLSAARSHGIGTAADLADYFRLTMPVARPLLAELVEQGELVPVEVEGWSEPALVHPEAKRPRQITGRVLLSPFDPVVWFRPRAERLFDFVYRIEIYVPEAKRIHGYYVLPFLLDGELVGRVCLKADRKQGRLLARASFAEEGVDRVRVAAEMGAALIEMAQWLDLDDVEVGATGDLAPQLRQAL
ncbi:MAG: winged helix-turn-helix domain-containing protein [Actinomycetia bacterium]|nr:winged helix-turn-helix domain-containing protein [Actinomycetes bacterium]MCP5032229.1 winged helix-turn-helix domain-containing protein [Actinomycetes bacterium]